MKILITSLLVIIISLVTIYQGHSQITTDTSKIWRIELVNENVYFGTIESRDTENIVFNSRELGIVNISVRNIKRMEEIAKDRLVDGKYWFDNPQAVRYFVSPTGFGLRKGEGYYQNVWVLFNQVSYGVSDNFSIGVGTVPLFLFSGSATPAWITPKVSIPISENVSFGAGAFLGTVLGAESGVFGQAFGSLTFGTRDKNLTTGLGYGFIDGEWSRFPAITISGMLRTGKRGYLISENYLFSSGSESFVLISFGGRRVGKKLTLDYGGFIPAGEVGGFVLIPWLGISIPIGTTNN